MHHVTCRVWKVNQPVKCSRTRTAANFCGPKLYHDHQPYSRNKPRKLFLTISNGGFRCAVRRLYTNITKTVRFVPARTCHISIQKSPLGAGVQRNCYFALVHTQEGGILITACNYVNKNSPVDDTSSKYEAGTGHICFSLSPHSNQYEIQIWRSAFTLRRHYTYCACATERLLVLQLFEEKKNLTKNIGNNLTCEACRTIYILLLTYLLHKAESFLRS